MAAEPFSSFPTSRETRFDSQPFSPPPLAPSPSSLASYYLPLPMWPSLGRLWPSSRSVRHSRSVGEAWVCIGVSCRKGFPRGRGKSEDERACAGTRPPPRPEPPRRSAFGSGGGAQLAVDTTLVSALRADGTVARKGATVGGEALRRARARKERTYPELAGEGGRARLVVLAAEVGGRWSNEASQFVRSLTWAKAQSAPESTQTQVAHAWNRRWRKLLACTAAKSFANTSGAHVTNRCRWHNTLRG